MDLHNSDNTCMPEKKSRYSREPHSVGNQDRSAIVSQSASAFPCLWFLLIEMNCCLSDLYLIFWASEVLILESDTKLSCASAAHKTQTSDRHLGFSSNQAKVQCPLRHVHLFCMSMSHPQGTNIPIPNPFEADCCQVSQFDHVILASCILIHQNISSFESHCSEHVSLHASTPNPVDTRTASSVLVRRKR